MKVIGCDSAEADAAREIKTLIGASTTQVAAGVGDGDERGQDGDLLMPAGQPHHADDRADQRPLGAARSVDEIGRAHV